MPTEEELIRERVKKLQEIRNLGINPYPYRYGQTAHAAQLKEKYQQLAAGENTKDHVFIAGRIMTFRRMGKASFCNVQDQTGQIQTFLKQDELGEKYDHLKLLDIGDWIGVSGHICKTKAGEVTVMAESYELLCKSIRPLPDKWHGLQDQELRYRMRYLDLAISPEVRKVFEQRSAIIQSMRELFLKKGFIEVETPVLQPVYGGANARPFTTHHHDLNMKMYMRVSPELYLKRLIVGGFERVFEIGHQFRNESIDRSHNPEFTSMECYQAYADYNDMMELTEDIYLTTAMAVLGTTKINYQGTEINLAKPWKRLTMQDAIKDAAGFDVEKMNDNELRELVTTYNLEIKGDLTRGAIIAELCDKLATPKLIQPTFLIHHPIETTPLCKPLRGNPALVERFEPFIFGMEIGNAYSELNDPILQRKLLEEQAKQLKAGVEEANPMDEDFIRAIEQGMPPTGGLGLGIDRMIMLLTNSASIRDVIFFPTMRLL